MSNVITAISVNVGAGATVDFQPAAKQAWEINTIGSNNAFVANVPDVQVAMKKGILTAIMLLDPTTDPGNRGRMHKYLCSNTVYLSVTNTGGAGAEISIVGKRINHFNVVSDVVAIGAGATIHVDPGVGAEAVIYEMGASVFAAGPADINPNITVTYDNLTLATAIIWDPTMIFAHDKQQAIPITHALQLNVTDSDGGGLNFAYSAEKTSNVVFQYENVLAGANLDVTPPAGQEWQIVAIAGSILAGGGAPNNYPDLTCGILIGADVSNILMAGSINTTLLWNAPYALSIDNTRKLRVNNVNGGAADVCVVGFRTR